MQSVGRYKWNLVANTNEILSQMRFELVHLLGESWFGLPAGVRLSLPSVAPAFEQSELVHVH